MFISASVLLIAGIGGIQVPLKREPAIVCLPSRYAGEIGNMRMLVADASKVPATFIATDGTLVLKLSKRGYMLMHRASELFAEVLLKKEITRLALTKAPDSLIPVTDLTPDGQITLKKLLYEKFPSHRLTNKCKFIVNVNASRPYNFGDRAVSIGSTPESSSGASKPLSLAETAEKLGEFGLEQLKNDESKKNYADEVSKLLILDQYFHEPILTRSQRLSMLSEALIDLRNWFEMEDSKIQDEIERAWFAGDQNTHIRAARRARSMEEFRQLAPKLFNSDLENLRSKFAFIGFESPDQVSAAVSTMPFHFSYGLSMRVKLEGSPSAAILKLN